MKSKGGKAKVLGTVVSVGGAMVLTLYKGIGLTKNRYNSLSSHSDRPVVLVEKKHEKWTPGTLALLAGCLSWSSWYSLQARIGMKYPALYSSNASMSFLSAVQSAALSLVLERDLSSWVLKSRTEVITVIYAGLVGSSLCFIVMAWCVKRRGPVFTAAFSPLIQMIVAIVDFSLLHKQLHIGSILGSILIIIGLYFLLWGKSMDTESFAVKQVQTADETQESSHPV